MFCLIRLHLFSDLYISDFFDLILFNDAIDDDFICNHWYFSHLGVFSLDLIYYYHVVGYNQSKNEKALAYLKNESLPHILDENVSEKFLEMINYYIS